MKPQDAQKLAEQGRLEDYCSSILDGRPLAPARLEEAAHRIERLDERSQTWSCGTWRRITGTCPHEVEGGHCP